MYAEITRDPPPVPPAPVNGGLYTGEPGRGPWAARPLPRDAAARVRAMNSLRPDDIPLTGEADLRKVYPHYDLVDNWLLVPRR